VGTSEFRRAVKRRSKSRLAKSKYKGRVKKQGLFQKKNSAECWTSEGELKKTTNTPGKTTTQKKQRTQGGQNPQRFWPCHKKAKTKKQKPATRTTRVFKGRQGFGGLWRGINKTSKGRKKQNLQRDRRHVFAKMSDITPRKLHVYPNEREKTGTENQITHCPKPSWGGGAHRGRRPEAKTKDKTGRRLQPVISADTTQTRDQGLGGNKVSKRMWHPKEGGK